MSTADKYREYLSNPALQPAIDTIKITTLQNENNRLTTRVLKLESELARYCESEQRGIVEIIVQRDTALARLKQAEALLKELNSPVDCEPEGEAVWYKFSASTICKTAAFLHLEQVEKEKKT